MTGIFIAGTGTGVGKSIVTGLLARALAESGKRVVTQKWIQTGSESFSDDIRTHFQLMNKEFSYFLQEENLNPETICPYSFKFPASPHLAAAKEGVQISKDRIISCYHKLKEQFEYILVEGVGGIYVPYNEKQFVINIAKELKLPVLLVCANQLGTISHTLLTIEALKNMKFKILGLIFTQPNPNENNEILENNIQIIKQLSDIEILMVFQYQEQINHLYNQCKLEFKSLIT